MVDQNTSPFLPTGTPTGDNFNDLISTLKFANQNMSQLIQQIIVRFGAQSATKSLTGISNAASSGTVVNIGTGYLMSISVTAPSSATSVTGTVYDSNTLTGLGSSCAIGVIPSSGFTTYNWPYSKGLVVTSASSNQTISVSYV